MRDAVGSTAAGFCIRAIIPGYEFYMTLFPGFKGRIRSDIFFIYIVLRYKKKCVPSPNEKQVLTSKKIISGKDDKIAIDFKIKIVYAIVLKTWSIPLWP